MRAQSNQFKIVSLVFFIAMLIFFTPHQAFPAQPGIYLDHYGVSTWTNSSGHQNLDIWIKIVDYDGIANDGSSHTVTVTYPDATVQTLNFNYKENDHTAAYSFWDGSIPQPIDPLVYSGNYVFRVEDSSADWSELTDTVTIDPINPPDETTFSPGFDPPESITAYFDNVDVNGSPYDDFGLGFDPAKWNWQPPEVTYVGGEARFDPIYNPGHGSVSMSFINPETVSTIKAQVRIGSVSSSLPSARIGGNFCSNNDGDIGARLAIRDNEAFYYLVTEWWEGNHLKSIYLVPETSLGPVTQGNNYDLSVDWDGGTFSFTVEGIDDSVYYNTTYSPPGPLGPADDNYKIIGVICYVTLDNTTPTFDWDEVPGSSFYQVRIYGLNDNIIWHGYTQAPLYTIPPGILKPNAIYKYRIDSFRDHQWIETDNKAGSDRNNARFITGPNEAQDPYVDLWSSGVQTWNQPSPFEAYTFFYVRINDAQGVPDNIESVKALLPDGITEVDLYLDYNETPNRGRYRGGYFGVIQAGTYDITVIDKDGNSHTQSEVLAANPIGPPSEATLEPANNAMIGGTGVNFDWDSVTGAATYELALYDKNMNYLFNYIIADSQHHLPPGLLDENSLYRYRIYTQREFFEENTDNGATVPSFGVYNANTFITTQTYGPSSPSLNLDAFGVAVWHGPHPATGASNYALELRAMVTDSDGVPENIERVEVTFPDGTTQRLLKYLDSPDWGHNYYTFEYYSNPAPIQAGVYTFRVVDFDGNETTLQDTLADATSNVLPWVLNATPIDGTVLSNTIPTITWDSVPGAAYYKVRIMSSYAHPTVHWSGELTQTEYTIPAGVLEANTIYGYRIYAYREASGNEVDFYSCNSGWHEKNNRFSTGAGSGDNTGDSLGVDFGSNGLWHYDGSWSRMTTWDANDGLTGWSGGLAVDFDGSGVWNNDGSSWSRITSWSSVNAGLTGWSGGLSADFGANGLWNFDGSSWRKLTNWNVNNGFTGWGGGLAVDFPIQGLWNYDGSSWSRITTWNVDSAGLAGWNSGVAADFGANGLWTFDGSAWSKLTNWNPENDLTGWTDGLAVDFGPNGLWSYDGLSWRRLTTWDPGVITGYADGLAVDFSTNGLWKYDGSAWSKITNWDPENMDDCDLN